MKIVKTVVWVILLAILLAFSAANWTVVSVNIWQGLIWETKLPAIVVMSFLLGLVPMWLLSAANRWRLRRRISALENAAQMASASLSSTHLSEVEADHELHPDN
mgnify:CR=1 FL=1